MLSNLIKHLIPPVITEKLRKVYNRYNGTTFHGPIDTWSSASLSSSGYQNHLLVETIMDASLKVKNGEAAFERDGIIHDKIQYSWPITAHMLRIAIENDNELRVLDFGGGFGSHYFQNRDMFKSLSKVKWYIVEQREIAEKGNLFFQNTELKFYEAIEQISIKQNLNIALFSGVLQYIEEPYSIVDQTIALGIDYILVDRTNFDYDKEVDEVYIQRNRNNKIKSEYPVYLLSYSKLNVYLESRGFKLVNYFDSLIDNLSFGKSMCLIYKRSY